MKAKVVKYDVTFHINHGMLLRRLYKRIVLLLCLAHGILQITFLKIRILKCDEL